MDEGRGTRCGFKPCLSQQPLYKVDLIFHLPKPIFFSCSVPFYSVRPSVCVVKVQKSDHPHSWDPCVNFCHTPNPPLGHTPNAQNSHNKTSTWTASSTVSTNQEYCKCISIYLYICLFVSLSLCLSVSLSLCLSV